MKKRRAADLGSQPGIAQFLGQARSAFVRCPVCSRSVPAATVNEHLDSCLAPLGFQPKRIVAFGFRRGGGLKHGEGLTAEQLFAATYCELVSAGGGHLQACMRRTCIAQWHTQAHNFYGSMCMRFP